MSFMIALEASWKKDLKQEDQSNSMYRIKIVKLKIPSPLEVTQKPSLNDYADGSRHHSISV